MWFIRRYDTSVSLCKAILATNFTFAHYSFSAGDKTEIVSRMCLATAFSWFFSVFVGLAAVSLLQTAVHKPPGSKCVCAFDVNSKMYRQAHPQSYACVYGPRSRQIIFPKGVLYSTFSGITNRNKSLLRVRVVSTHIFYFALGLLFRYLACACVHCSAVCVLFFFFISATLMR